MNNASTNLDAALLADGVLWRAAEAAYQAALTACRDDIGAEAAMEAAGALKGRIQRRILATPASTQAGMAIKLAIFASCGPNDSLAEDVAYRAEHLAELIASGHYEDAAAFSLAVDLAASMKGAAAPTPAVVPLPRKPRPAKRGGPTLPLAA